MTFEKISNGKGSKEGNGRGDIKIENGYYLVPVVWKNGEKSTNHFPESGFTIVNPGTNDVLGYINGEKAVSILKEHSSEYNREDFSWIPFL